MSGFDQSSIAVSMPTVVGADAALGGPYKIKPSEAFSGALMTVSGLTGETISVQTSPDGYWGAPASPTFYRTDWQGTQQLYSTARTNLGLWSEEIDNVAWGKANASIIANATTAPSGAATMDKIVEAAINAVHYAQEITVVSNGATVTHSIHLKNAERTSTELIDPYSLTGITVDLLTGLTSAPTTGGVSALPANKVSITKLNAGGYRAAITVTAPATNTALRVSTVSGGSTLYVGDGTSGIYCWGYQLEYGSTLTSYIGPTTTTAVTLTDYTLSNGVITVSPAPLAGATLSYDNGVLPSPYYIFTTGDGTRTAFAYDGVWGTLPANSGKGNGIWQVDLRGAQAYRLVKSAGSETATVNMTLKRDALQYTNSAGTWSVT